MEKQSITKGDLTLRMAKQLGIDMKLVDSAVKEILSSFTDELLENGRIEIRGFGSFHLSERAAGQKRNPKTGELVDKGTRWVVRFKAGKALRERVNYH